jgi:hypothetical protein
MELVWLTYLVLGWPIWSSVDLFGPWLDREGEMELVWLTYIWSLVGISGPWLDREGEMELV